MQKIAKFEKVSKKQFVQDWLDTFTTATQAEAIQIYDQLQLPKRATIGSAGYDFFAPQSFILKPGESIKIPTGIRVQIAAGWVLNIGCSLTTPWELLIPTTMIPIMKAIFSASCSMIPVKKNNYRLLRGKALCRESL